jgi:Raf kinase inhibitor-like YbhB/YbcL family protein
MRLTEPAGALQGRNSRGQIGYIGPRPPAGDPPHHYHFQVFALDTTLAAPPALDREALLRAVEGHVLARGEHVGTFQAAK